MKDKTWHETLQQPLVSTVLVVNVWSTNTKHYSSCSHCKGDEEQHMDREPPVADL